MIYCKLFQNATVGVASNAMKSRIMCIWSWWFRAYAISDHGAEPAALMRRAL